MTQNTQMKLLSQGHKTLELDMRNIQDSMAELVMMICLRPSVIDFEILSIERPAPGYLNYPAANNHSKKPPQTIPFASKKLR